MLLRENGFLVVHPERMTFAEQVRLVKAHASIVSSVGSAAHNVLFGLGRPELHLLACGDNIPMNYFLCSALVGAPTSFVDCLGTGGRPNFNDERSGGRGGRIGRRGGERDVADVGGGTQSTPQLVDIPTLVDYLAARGLLKSQPPVRRGAADAMRQDRYDEAWLCARIRVARRGRVLPPEIESEATRVAERSWPVSWMLARYYTSDNRNPSGAEAMVQRFVELAAVEPDPARLAHFRAEIAATAARIRRMCCPDTLHRLDAVLADCFQTEPEDGAAASAE